MLNSPRFLLTIGFLLLLVGWVIPLLTIMQMIPSTFVFGFLSWSASVAGLFLGFIGGAMMVKINRDE